MLPNRLPYLAATGTFAANHASRGHRTTGYSHKIRYQRLRAAMTTYHSAAAEINMCSESSRGSINRSCRRTRKLNPPISAKRSASMRAEFDCAETWSCRAHNLITAPADLSVEGLPESPALGLIETVGATVASISFNITCPFSCNLSILVRTLNETIVSRGYAVNKRRVIKSGRDLVPVAAMAVQTIWGNVSAYWRVGV
jgi:hypothetical protein